VVGNKTTHKDISTEQVDLKALFDFNRCFLCFLPQLSDYERQHFYEQLHQILLPKERAAVLM